MNTARGFGEYDILAEAVFIAWRAEQRLNWQAARSWWDRLLDACAMGVVWLAAAAALLLAVAMLGGAAWLVLALMRLL